MDYSGLIVSVVLLSLAVGSVLAIIVYFILRLAIRDGVEAALRRAPQRP